MSEIPGAEDDVLARMHLDAVRNGDWEGASALAKVIETRRVPPSCEHEWSERGGGPEDPWWECWLCGTTRDMPPTVDVTP